jgi:hypothetical protein
VRRTEYAPWRGSAAAQRRGDVGEPPDQPDQMVALVKRLIVTQTGLAAAIGLSYSRRHLPSIIITLMLAAALWALALAVRSGTHAAWILAISSEAVFVLFGLVRFLTSRYVGGTLFAMIIVGVLLHPAVARAFAAAPRRDRQALRESDLADTADGALGSSAAG